MIFWARLSNYLSTTSPKYEAVELCRMSLEDVTKYEETIDNL